MSRIKGEKGGCPMRLRVPVIHYVLYNGDTIRKSLGPLFQLELFVFEKITVRLRRELLSELGCTNLGGALQIPTIQ